MAFADSDVNYGPEIAAQLWREMAASLKEVEATIREVARSHPLGYCMPAIALMTQIQEQQGYFRKRLPCLSLIVRRKKLEARKPQTRREWLLLGEWVVASNMLALLDVMVTTAYRTLLASHKEGDDPHRATVDAMLTIIKDLPVFLKRGIESSPRPEQREAAWYLLAGWMRHELPYAPKDDLLGLTLIAFAEEPRGAKGWVSRAIDEARADERVRGNNRRPNPTYNKGNKTLIEVLMEAPPHHIGEENVAREFERVEEMQAALEQVKPTLSTREAEILELRLSGLKYANIADRLQITESTVKNTMARIRKKVRAA
ncbi:MAG: sigma-70 family RNA polymerase sigma factor [Actinobacteria bacterium]|nr:sigma-70 family RNA polymerase sigma factor [Actinomycetota bacterium]